MTSPLPPKGILSLHEAPNSHPLSFGSHFGPLVALLELRWRGQWWGPNSAVVVTAPHQVNVTSFIKHTLFAAARTGDRVLMLPDVRTPIFSATPLGPSPAAHYAEVTRREMEMNLGAATSASIVRSGDELHFPSGGSLAVLTPGEPPRGSLFDLAMLDNPFPESDARDRHEDSRIEGYIEDFIQPHMVSGLLVLFLQGGTCGLVEPFLKRGWTHLDLRPLVSR